MAILFIQCHKYSEGRCDCNYGACGKLYIIHYTGVSSVHSHKACTDLGLFSRHIAVGPWNVVEVVAFVSPLFGTLAATHLAVMEHVCWILVAFSNVRPVFTIGVGVIAGGGSIFACSHTHTHTTHTIHTQSKQ